MSSVSSDVGHQLEIRNQRMQSYGMSVFQRNLSAQSLGQKVEARGCARQWYLSSEVCGIALQKTLIVQCSCIKGLNFVMMQAVA